MKISQAMPSRAPIILTYGAEGRGKTTLLSKFAKVVAILLERGLPRGISVDAINDVNSFEDLMSALRELYADPRGYQTLGIDTIDALEALLVQYLCAKNGWKTVETPSFGKGWVAADDEWRRFLRAITAIRDRHNMTIVMTCHASIERIDDPRAPSYTSYVPRLHKRARGLVMDTCDAVWFLSEDLHVVVEGEGFRERHRANASPQRFIFAEARPAFVAKNRYGMPFKLPLPLDSDLSEIAKYWSNNAND
jgi:AAA domain